MLHGTAGYVGVHIPLLIHHCAEYFVGLASPRFVERSCEAVDAQLLLIPQALPCITGFEATARSEVGCDECNPGG
jgi:hypothetical protein